MTLKNVLTINALTSGATGLGLVLFSKAIAALFGVTNAIPFVGVGIFLFAFAVLVFVESRRNPHQLGSVRTIITLDIVWVVVSLAVVLLQLFSLSTVGYVLITAVALWVAAMAFLQSRGLGQTTTAAV